MVTVRRVTDMDCKTNPSDIIRLIILIALASNSWGAILVQLVVFDVIGFVAKQDGEEARDVVLFNV